MSAAMTLEEENQKLKQELDKVRAERDKYKQLFDVSADALSIIDLESSCFIECNSAAVQMHGVENEQNFLNLSPAQISPEFQACGRPSNEMAREYITKTVTEGPQVFQWLHSRLDGTVFECLVSLTAIPVQGSTLVLAIGRDISPLVKVQRELELALLESTRFEEAYLHEKEKFEQFVDLAPIGIAINKMADGAFKFVNKEFSRFTGYKINELNEMDYWQLTPEEYAEQEAEQLTRLQESGRYGPYKKHYIHQKGHRYPVLLSGIRIVARDGEEQIWSVVQDISQQQEAEDTLRRAKDEAIQASNAKSEFLSNMSHEIRTPMNGVLGTLQLLGEENNSEKGAKLISNAIFSANTLLTIINDILDYSKIESNQLTIEQVDFSLALIAESVIADMEPVAQEKGITLALNIEANMPLVWIGDPVRIRQIMMNLISNAVKFTEQGSVEVSLRESERGGLAGLLIDITDTGIGMSKEAVSSLFERFTQADSTITRKFGGTGLGMSITNNLVSLMDGNIRVASSEGKGTKFVIFIPLLKSKKAEVKLAEARDIAIPDLTEKRVLVAEDNFVNREIIESMLEKTHAEIHFAENGQEALALFPEINPDIVLMDIQMPIMDGKEAFKRIRQINSTVPIVALTANVMSQDIRDYRAMGFTGHLGKPFDIQQIYRCLTVHLFS
ncbi:ATP-binding protein [Planctobacterium marinum]|uniref:histidine kinase n=1 Tax=Planctobacterium marinum TaxID=1631968 RepID=A0AA48HRZ3_9ALTE|nr:hypothetical protein MACH26_40630 [Planctobacterium marinum]